MGIQVLLGAFALVVKIPEDRQVVVAVDPRLVSVGPEFFIADGAEGKFGGFRVVPEIGCLGEPLLFFDEFQFAVDVKDTSSRHQALSEGLSVVPAGSCSDFQFVQFFEDQVRFEPFSHDKVVYFIPDDQVFSPFYFILFFQDQRFGQFFIFLFRDLLHGFGDQFFGDVPGLQFPPDPDAAPFVLAELAANEDAGKTEVVDETLFAEFFHQCPDLRFTNFPLLQFLNHFGGRSFPEGAEPGNPGTGGIGGGGIRFFHRVDLLSTNLRNRDGK
jgi:hypothetical protein